MLREYIGMTFLSHSGTTQHQHQQRQQDGGQEPQQPLQQQQQLADLSPGLCLTGLPLLLDGYVPDLSCIPQLILRLARDVDWDTEQECFKSLAEVLAAFYAVQPLLSSSSPADSSKTAAGCAVQDQATGSSAQFAGAVAADAPTAMDVDGSTDKPSTSPGVPGADSTLLAGHRDQQQREWLLRHVLMPAVKFMFKPPQHRARDGSVLLLTSMEKLYRVFERCGW